MEIYKTKVDTQTLNNALLLLAQTLEQNGDTYVDNFPITVEPYAFKNEETAQAFKEQNKLDSSYDAEACFNYFKQEYEVNTDNIQDARKIGVVAGRMLESKPDHPGLILLQTCAKVISAEYEKMIVVHDLTAAIQYAKTRYSVTDSVLWPVVWQVLNLMLNTSADLFDLALILISETQHYAQVKLLDHLLTADEVSDDNREYILMQ